MSGLEPLKRPSSHEHVGQKDVDSNTPIKVSKPAPTAESDEIKKTNEKTRSFLGNILHRLSQISLRSIWNFLSGSIRTIRNLGSNFLTLIGVRSREVAETAPISQTKTPPVYFVNQMIEALKEKQVFTVVGIFRVSGTKVDVDEYFSQLKQGKDVSFEDETNIHNIGSALKGYINGLKILENLPEVRTKFIEVGKEAEKAKQIQLMKEVLESISKDHRDVLEPLVAFCQEIADHEKITKMTLENLATCLTPNIIGGGDLNHALEEVAPSTAAFKFLIENQGEVF